ncbi:MAG: metal-dependent hydrolase, partial [Bacteroidota bacterium]
MDSLTQIVLGAAVGEATLGRKVGNRAMLWGAIGGTIPDLDVFANLATDPVSSLAYHRAFTHSLAFGLLAPPLLGIVIHRLYGGQERGLGKQFSVPWEMAIIAMVFYALLLVGSQLMPIEVLQIPRIALTITGVTALIIAIVGIRERIRRRPSKNGNASFWGWTILFFGAIITHPLLDCFTPYGTQLFSPFSTGRETWNTIAVVDPLYTIPFLLLLILAGRKLKGSKTRKRLNTAGLIVSSI